MQERGIDPSQAAVLDDFLAGVVPELQAVKELRRQYLKGSFVSEIEYIGRSVSGHPVDFLLEHYGDAIRSGEIGPGNLGLRDRPLYSALRECLKKPQEFKDRVRMEGSLKSVGDLFNCIKGLEKPVDFHTARLKACAEVLQTSEDEASRFFSRLRYDRQLGNNRPSSKSR